MREETQHKHAMILIASYIRLLRTPSRDSASYTTKNQTKSTLALWTDHR